MSTGQSVDVKLISINYTDTHGNLVKVGDDPALQAKFSQTINGSSGPVQTSPTNVKIGYSEGDGWGNGPYWPKAKVTKFTAKINPVIGANDGEGLKKPFIYLIAPKGAKITQGVPSIVGLKYRNPNTINDGPALDYLFPSTPSTPKIDTVELSDGRIMYYAAAENTIRGNASSLEILQSRLLVTLEGVEKGIYDFELGVGSLESDNYNVTEANGYTQNNINSEVKSILGASSSKVYTKKLQAEIDANYETSRKSFVRAPESSNFTEIITGNEFAKVMPSTDVDFKYELKNTGSVLLKELEFIDILPFPGDKNITNGLNRGSEFPVYLGNDPKVSKGGAPIGVAVYYSTSSDPKRLNSSGSQIGTGEWTTVKPAIEDIKAIKLKLVDKL
ncbi:hypothetical protein MX850_08955 [Erysipelothrix sp. Poltava]|nr:hypothetical protein MX850_08955 [Erysipelothrix sp. Poltava]